jgi:hypothetical protein
MTQPTKTFQQTLDELKALFINAEGPDESDDEIASDVFEFILNYERLRHQVKAGSTEAQAVDQSTIEKLRLWDSNDPAMSTVEKVLRRLAQGRGIDGITLLKDAILWKAQEFGKQQSKVAKHPRPSRQQPMTGLVEDIVRGRPTISQNDLFHALRNKLATMDEPPYSFSGESFKSHSAQFPDIEKNNLRQYLSRARKKLSP